MHSAACARAMHSIAMADAWHGIACNVIDPVAHELHGPRSIHDNS